MFNCLMTKGIKLCIDYFGILAFTGYKCCIYIGRLLQYTSHNKLDSFDILNK